MSKIRKFELLGIIFIFTVGVLFHYAFELTGYFTPLAWLFAVNESLFEHAKLAVFPMFIWLGISYRYIKDEANNIFAAKAIELVVLFLTHQVLYYALDTTFVFFDYNILVQILISQVIFLFGLFAGQLTSIAIMSRNSWGGTVSITALIFIVAYIAFIIYATYYPPEYILFYDYLNNVYGILEP